jgi:hypothetical protein
MIACWRFIILSIAFQVGCGSDPATPSDPGTPKNLGDDQRSVTTVPVNPGTLLPSVLYASFIEETDAGEAPALVAFQNDTKFIMSLWLGQAEFIAIPSGLSVGPELAASAAVETDTTTGQHKNGACVKFPINKFDGPSVLDPGQSYSMHIALDPVLGFVGSLTEEQPRPFVGVRAKVLDPTSDAFHPSRLHLALLGNHPDGRGGSPSFTTYDENRTNYVNAGTTAFTAMLTFSAGSGKRYAAAGAVEIPVAPGYTVEVDVEPRAGAAAVVALEATSP